MSRSRPVQVHRATNGTMPAACFPLSPNRPLACASGRLRRPDYQTRDGCAGLVAEFRGFGFGGQS